MRISESEISLALVDVFDVLGCLCSCLLIRDELELLGDELFAYLLGFGRSIILKVLLQSHQSIGVAAVLDLTCLAEGHKSVACSAFTVAGGTEGRDISKLHQPLYDFIERTLVGNIKLLGIMRALVCRIACITADRSS